ncbi:MAG: hypothetical protein M3371_14750 [Acidobacteriota bacterium]|nr:hypothetical protein [Acidobacteriota bacterium]
MKNCPRCHSVRLQRGYHDPPLTLWLLGLREFLCNKCGLEFKRFAPLAKAARAASTKQESTRNRRRSPRYGAHLPASISLIEINAETGEVGHSPPARGHCTTISKYGLAVSFIGTRFKDADFAQTGRPLLITVMLPNGPAEMLVTTITHERPAAGQGARQGWLLGSVIREMRAEDRARLEDYLDSRAESNVSL